MRTRVGTGGSTEAASALRFISETTESRSFYDLPLVEVDVIVKGVAPPLIELDALAKAVDPLGIERDVVSGP